ncbi:hypothetical protein MNBD_GAMMA25-2399 [hydrothermal vent metagenome]|uniref:Uncharacterized protein n=1 Tax=hydrothermal vent metagenome TaxID=652676 RepID=A0A3B1BTK0_9ZZZZ
MSALEMDAQTLSQALSQIADHVIEARRNAFTETNQQEPNKLDADIDRFLKFIDLTQKGKDYPSLRTKTGPLTDRNIMADLGLQVINTLNHWALHLQLEDTAGEIETLTLSLALWCAREDCQLSVLEPLVNAVSDYANRQSEADIMSELTLVVGEIIDAISPVIKQDTDRSDPHRPWRLLNFNYGIIATRSLQPAIMEQAFENILKRFPDDAASFFREGMEQMQAIDYPDYVRTVMEKYFETTNNPTLH